MNKYQKYLDALQFLEPIKKVIKIAIYTQKEEENPQNDFFSFPFSFDVVLLAETQNGSFSSQQTMCDPQFRNGRRVQGPRQAIRSDFKKIKSRLGNTI